jgi:hypothetical protein
VLLPENNMPDYAGLSGGIFLTQSTLNFAEQCGKTAKFPHCSAKVRVFRV